MPPSPAYHPTEPPDSPSEDSDSELELDLEELDPKTSGAPGGGGTSNSNNSSHNDSSSNNNNGTNFGRPANIALRKLRMGGLRRAGTRGRGYGDGGSGRDDYDDDNRGLLNDADPMARRDSDTHDEDDGLLSGSSRLHRRRRSSFASDTIQSFAGRLRLPSFMSTSSLGQNNSNRGGLAPEEEAANDDEDDAQDDDDPSTARLVAVGSAQTTRFPPNLISNAKYTAWSFLPVTLYNEFSFFFNMYFLLVALSQAIPQLRIGYLSTYVAPLAFVLMITLGKEAYDDVERRRRDNEANSEEYMTLQFVDPVHGGLDASGFGGSGGKKRKTLRSDSSTKAQRRRLLAVAQTERERLSDIQEEEEQLEGRGRGRKLPASRVVEVSKKSRDLKVGDVLKLTKGQRVPADVVILKCLSPETAAETDDETDEDEQPTKAPEANLLNVDDDDVEGSASNPAVAAPAKKEESSGGGSGGETFIRTDQLDGETDWKLRLASPLSQNLPSEELVRLRVTGGKPDKKVNEFVGTLELLPSRDDAMDNTASSIAVVDDEDEDDEDGSSKAKTSAGLSIDNTAWANTVIASHATTLAVIVYTGPQTRSALSTAPSRSKTGLLEFEINSLTKILCALTLALSIILVALEEIFEKKNGSSGAETVIWYVKIMRFLVLFSTIVPISLRVNLDLGKSVYSWFIQRDPGIPGAVVRTSTIPEDLGRIEYLLSDKTGTLTQNEMEMKKIHVGTVSYANEAMDEVAEYVRQSFAPAATLSSATSPSADTLVTPSSTLPSATGNAATRTRREIGSRVRDIVLALALCHNVTPTDRKSVV